MPSPTWFNLAPGKRQRIVDAALNEFGRRGFSAGSLNVIAREAGIAKGSLFQYFADKRDLYAHVCDECSRRIRDEFGTTLAARWEQHDDVFAFLRHLLVDWVRYIRDHPREQTVVFAANFEIDSESRRAVREVVNRHYLEVLQPVVEHAAATGQLRAGASPEHFLALLMMLAPHLATAPFAAELDPVLQMHSRDELGLEAAVVGFVDALEAAYGRVEPEAQSVARDSSTTSKLSSSESVAAGR